MEMLFDLVTVSKAQDDGSFTPVFDFPVSVCVRCIAHHVLVQVRHRCLCGTGALTPVRQGDACVLVHGQQCDYQGDSKDLSQVPQCGHEEDSRSSAQVPQCDHKMGSQSLGQVQLNDHHLASGNDGQPLLLEVTLTSSAECARLGSVRYVLTTDSDSYVFQFRDAADMHRFHDCVVQVCEHAEHSSSVFDDRTDDLSAKQYFTFYGCLAQQQNMLEDYIRTSTYQCAMLGNTDNFADKVVLDVGAGSGILSFFAVQAGARKVYAVEASAMASHAEALVQSNQLAGKIVVIAGKLEEVTLPEMVDVVVSEPMGYMLFNERMLETYLHAKKWLKREGAMFPSRAHLHVAPFSDHNLYMERCTKANFWYQQCFHGVDISALRHVAMKEYFRQPVVDTFDINMCMAESVYHVVDFEEATESDLHRIHIPLRFFLNDSGTLHGLAFWFDVAFIGKNSTLWLSTAPTEPVTQWYQVRCLLETPIFVRSSQILTGNVLLVANRRQSYDMRVELCIEGTGIRCSTTMDLLNPYFRYGHHETHSKLNHTSPSETYWTVIDTQVAQDGAKSVGPEEAPDNTEVIPGDQE